MPRSTAVLAALVSLLLAGALLVPATTAGAGGVAAPIGHLDRVEVRWTHVTMHGWALDRDGSDPIMVHVYVDGAVAVTKRATVRRTDVGAAHGMGNYHGFAVRVPVPAGRHRVCISAINDGRGADTPLGCRSVTGRGGTGNRPIGALDRVEVDGGTVTASGWALDVDTRRPIEVRLRVDGKLDQAKKARGVRKDLIAAYQRGPKHGYGFETSLSTGRHTVCVIAVDHAGVGGFNRKLGCETVQIGGGGGGNGTGVVVSPTGVVLPVTGRNGSGWVVTTPCTNTTTINQGTFVGGVDVVLDPGHGGSESGAVGANGTVEKTLNLIVAQKTKDMLEARGYSVLLTRTTDIRLPLVSRGAIANALDPAVFVSIHHNGGASWTRDTPGTEIYYQHGSDDSQRLSGILYEELFAAMNRYDITWTYGWRAGVSTRLTSEGANFYGIHRYTPNVPSAITEPGYLSNPAEAALFARADVQDAQAVALAAGIQRYLTSSDAGSGYLGSFVDDYSTGTGGTGGCVDPALT